MGHGTHWRCILDDVDNEVSGLLSAVYPKSKVIGAREVQTWNGPVAVGPAKLILLEHAEHGVGFVSVIVSEDEKRPNLHNCFPAVAGVRKHIVSVEEVIASSFGTEATVRAVLGEAQIEFFDPYYALTESVYQPGKEVEVALAGLVYLASVPKAGQTIEHPSVGVISLDSAAMLFPIEPEARQSEADIGYGLAYILGPSSRSNGDFDFRGPVKSIETIHVFGHPAWHILSTPLRMDGNKVDIDIDLYVLERNLLGGTRPEVGGDFEGHLWLQGTTWDRTS